MTVLSDLSIKVAFCTQVHDMCPFWPLVSTIIRTKIQLFVYLLWCVWVGGGGGLDIWGFFFGSTILSYKWAWEPDPWLLLYQAMTDKIQEVYLIIC